MRLSKIGDFLTQHSVPFQYWEDNDSGSYTFLHKGLSYHIWEYPEPERGACSNIRSAGRDEDYEGDYEEQLLAILRTWPV